MFTGRLRFYYQGQANFLNANILKFWSSIFLYQTGFNLGLVGVLKFVLDSLRSYFNLKISLPPVIKAESSGILKQKQFYFILFTIYSLDWLYSYRLDFFSVRLYTIKNHERLSTKLFDRKQSRKMLFFSFNEFGQ